MISTIPKIILKKYIPPSCVLKELCGCVLRMNHFNHEAGRHEELFREYKTCRIMRLRSKNKEFVPKKYSFK